VIERTVSDITNEALAAHFEHWQPTPEAINAYPSGCAATSIGWKR